MSDNQDDLYIIEARRLLASALDTPELVSQIGDDVGFLEAGVNSGEMILLLLQCEKHLGVEVQDDELFAVTSLRELSRFLGRHTAESDRVV